MGAAHVLARYPIGDSQDAVAAFVHGEIVRLVIKAEAYDSPLLPPHMVGAGTVYGFKSLGSAVDKLDSLGRYRSPPAEQQKKKR